MTREEVTRVGVWNLEAAEDQYRFRIDMPTISDEITKKIVAMHNTIIQEAVIGELRRQGYTIIPPDTPTNGGSTNE